MQEILQSEPKCWNVTFIRQNWDVDVTLWGGKFIGNYTQLGTTNILLNVLRQITFDRSSHVVSGKIEAQILQIQNEQPWKNHWTFFFFTWSGRKEIQCGVRVGKSIDELLNWWNVSVCCSEKSCKYINTIGIGWYW